MNLRFLLNWFLLVSSLAILLSSNSYFWYRNPKTSSSGSLPYLLFEPCKLLYKLLLRLLKNTFLDVKNFRSFEKTFPFLVAQSYLGKEERNMECMDWKEVEWRTSSVLKDFEM